MATKTKAPASPARRPDVLHVWRHALTGTWHWWLKSANGQVLASGGGYRRRGRAIEMAERVTGRTAGVIE